MSLRGFFNADWGKSKDRHSITGYNFQLLLNGSMISWKITATVALSTTDHMELAAAIQKAKFFIQLLNTMVNSNENEHVTIYCENQCIIAVESKWQVYWVATCKLTIKDNF